VGRHPDLPVLEERMELRERQMEEASAQKVAAVAAERDGQQQP
jgi:hypothetical protein